MLFSSTLRWLEFYRPGKSHGKIVSNTATCHIEQLDIEHSFADINLRSSLGREGILFVFTLKYKPWQVSFWSTGSRQVTKAGALGALAS